jgi:glycine/D-amino acid oxidase-like deaminating enzyme
MTSQLESEVLIIGAGIIGASIARELSQYKVNVAVVEKNPDCFTGQTKSSHGLIYPKNKLKRCMRVLANVRTRPPVRLGHVIVPNILDTGADIVTQADLLV